MIYSKWRSKCLRTVTTDQSDSFNWICLWENERAPPEKREVHICEVKTYLTVQPRRGPAESTSQTCRPQLSRLGFGLALLGQFSILLPVQLLTLTQPLSHILWYFDTMITLNFDFVRSSFRTDPPLSIHGSQISYDHSFQWRQKLLWIAKASSMQFRAAHKTPTVNPTQANNKKNIKKEHPRPSQIPKYSKSNKTSCRWSRESIIMFFGPGIRIESFVLQCYGIQITKFITGEKCHLVLCVLQNY